MKHAEIEANHIKKLKWAILLSRTDFDGLREGDWINLKSDLYDFIYGVHSTIRNSYQVYGGKWGSRHLNRETFIKDASPDITRQVAHIFREWLEGATLYDNLDPFRVPLRDVIHEDAGCFFLVENDSGRFAPVFAIDDIRIASEISLALHIAGSRITKDQIRHCDYQSCKALFLSERKPRRDRKHYCSDRCARNAASRAYRERKERELKEKEKLRSKARYAKKIRSKSHMAKVKIRSRQSHS